MLEQRWRNSLKHLNNSLNLKLTGMADLSNNPIAMPNGAFPFNAGLSILSPRQGPGEGISFIEPISVGERDKLLCSTDLFFRSGKENGDRTSHDI